VASGTYLACYFFGGLVGSAVLGQLFDRFGWTACVTGVGCRSRSGDLDYATHDTARIISCEISDGFLRRSSSAMARQPHRRGLHTGRFQRPQERQQSGEAKAERQRHEDDQHLHQASRSSTPDRRKARIRCANRMSPWALRARKAFSMTRMDEPDIAAAAISASRRR